MSGDDFLRSGCESASVTESSPSIEETIDRHGLAPFFDAPAELHDILGSPLRKCVLIELAEEENPLTPDELAGRVVECEESEVTNRSEALVRLHHVHLPKLRSCGIVSVYNENEEYTVDLHP